MHAATLPLLFCWFTPKPLLEHRYFIFQVGDWDSERCSPGPGLQREFINSRAGSGTQASGWRATAVPAAPHTTSEAEATSSRLPPGTQMGCVCLVLPTVLLGGGHLLFSSL